MAGETDAFEEHVATPHGLDFAAGPRSTAARHERAADLDGLRAALESAAAQRATTIVEMRTDRAANVDAAPRVWDAVSAALS